MAEPTAFRTFAMEPPYQVRSLRRMLQKKIEELTAALSGGYAKDWADYRERVGEISGLLEAVGFCDELEKAESK